MQKRVAFGTLAAVFTVFLGAWGMAFAQVPVTECGQVIAAGQTGVLVADLECPSDTDTYCILAPEVPCETDDDCPPRSGGCGTPAAVTLANRATLELDGHTISGGFFGVRVHGYRGTVRGPGQIVAGDPHVLARVRFERRLEISDVTLDGGLFGIFGNNHKCRLYATNVTVNNASSMGVWVGALKATNLTVNGSGNYGIYGARITGSTNITANFNGGDSWGGHGIAVDRIRATNVETKGNTSAGVSSTRGARLIGLASMDNGGPGLQSERGAILIDSTLTGNNTAGGGVDILTERHPRLVNTVCERSENSETAEPWGVCSLD